VILLVDACLKKHRQKLPERRAMLASTKTDLDWNKTHAFILTK
jgi:hypothetical protein